MAEKGEMAGTFELTPGLLGSLCLRDREYVVKDPVEIVVETKDGGRLKPPQEIRERIVRCRDCEHASPCPLADSEKLMCAFHDEMLVNPGDFCSWGMERDA